MKRVVLIAPDFSPSSLPPALRIRFFAAHLPAFGWEPIVLAVEPKYYPWAVDPENEQLLPEGLRVIRTKAFSAGAARRMGVGDIAMRSLWQHWRALKKLCREESPDLVFISSPPFVSMLLGRMAHARFGIPYVIDYIDPWVSDYYRRMPKAERPANWFVADWMSRTLEPVALRRAAHITAVSRGTTDGIVPRYPWLTDAQTAEIPYGGEPADFDYLRRHPRRQNIFQKGGGLVHISYVGRGGNDMHRALRALFHCFRDGVADQFRHVRLHFVGTDYAPNATEQVMPLAREYGLEAFVTEHPKRVSYLDAIQILLDSDALIAIGSESPHYTASKIFPYILAERPLLAIYHEASSVVEILRESRGGRAVSFATDQPESRLLAELAPALRELVATVEGYRPAGVPAAFESYTTRAMAGRLAAVFDNVVHTQESEVRSGNGRGQFDRVTY